MHREYMKLQQPALLKYYYPYTLSKSVKSCWCNYMTIVIEYELVLYILNLRRLLN